jgi:Family of unknown function (DUF6326)
VLDQASVPVAVKLSALWASTMFMYAYVDIFSFYKPGVVRDILRGKVWEFEITQAWALGALALMTIPALMVFLSVGLRPASPVGRTSSSPGFTSSSRWATWPARAGRTCTSAPQSRSRFW